VIDVAVLEALFGMLARWSDHQTSTRYRRRKMATLRGVNRFKGMALHPLRDLRRHKLAANAVNIPRRFTQMIDARAATDSYSQK
jgi:hypothetical protein